MKKTIIISIITAVISGIFLYHYKDILENAKGYNSDDGFCRIELQCSSPGTIKDKRILDQITFYPCELNIYHNRGPSIEGLSITLESQNDLDKPTALRKDDPGKVVLSPDKKTVKIDIKTLRKGSVIQYKFQSYGIPKIRGNVVVKKGALPEFKIETTKIHKRLRDDVLSFTPFIFLIVILVFVFSLILLMKYNYSFTVRCGKIIGFFNNLFNTDEIKYVHRQPDIHTTPKLISSGQKSASTLKSSFLEGQSGSITTFVYVDDPSKGILNIKNNRYIIGHDTNQGRPVAGKSSCSNAFGLSRTPKSQKNGIPCWRLWISNAIGIPKYLDTEKPIAETIGWHHFVIRWNHSQPILELLINGEVICKTDDYLDCWPENLADDVFLGTWPNLASEHYIETELFRTFIFETYIHDRWIKFELKNGLQQSKSLK